MSGIRKIRVLGGLILIVIGIMSGPTIINYLIAGFGLFCGMEEYLKKQFPRLRMIGGAICIGAAVSADFNLWNLAMLSIGALFFLEGYETRKINNR